MFFKKSHLTITLLTILVSFTFIISGLFSYYSAKNTIKKEIINSSLPLLSENIYSEIHQSLSLPLNVASLMSRDTFLVNWIVDGENNPKEITDYLKNLKEKYELFSTFYISESTKKYYYYNGILKEISTEDKHDLWYSSFIESGKQVDLDVDSNEASEGSLTIFINYRIEDSKKNLLGVVGVGIRLDKIAHKLIEKKEQYNRNVYLVDEEGIVQVHSDIKLVEKMNIYKKEGIKSVADQLMTQNNDPVEMTFSSPLGKMFVSSRYIPELEWHVFVEQDEKSSLHDAQRSLIFHFFITLSIAIIIILISNRILKGFENQMESIAGTDNLTDTANRRELSKQFEVYKYRNKRYGASLSILLIDLDNFKEINDRFGHLEGDSVLKKLALILKESIRPIDLPVRWGGDEFIIVMEASKADATLMAERIMEQIKQVSYGESKTQDENNKKRSLTVSIGIAEYIEEDNFKSLMARADKALYQSKENGKNMISLEVF